MDEQITQKRVEPNSGLGQAFHYLLRRWDRLTMFLRIPDAPLDNNICERAMNMAIRHRRNSLFYRSLNGAWVGDIYMTLIHTARLYGENPFAYLTALFSHEAAVADRPADWLPWNYRQPWPASDEPPPGPHRGIRLLTNDQPHAVRRHLIPGHIKHACRKHTLKPIHVLFKAGDPEIGYPH